MSRRFIHYTFPYAYWSAGLRAIHYYCHLMRKAGYDSYVTAEGNPEWDTPVWDGKIRDTDIVIYPEPPHFDRGINPLGAKNIVRYFLYYTKDDYGIVPKTEYPIVFANEFLANCQDGNLQVSCTAVVHLDCQFFPYKAMFPETLFQTVLHVTPT